MLEFGRQRVVVVGGGPAGSTAGLLLARNGWDVTIIEPRSAKTPSEGEKRSPCVGCAGLLQKNVLELLGSLNLFIPEEIIQTKIETNTLHLPGGQTVIIPTEAATVYRGFGPVQSPVRIRGFDAWLLDEAHQAGAKVVESKVEKIALSDQGNLVYILGDRPLSADFVIGAYGHNQINIQLPSKKKPIEAPIGQAACVREYLLGNGTVSKLAGANNFFISPTRAIGFGAIFPKNEFISISLMGRGKNGVKPGHFNEFLGLKSVIDLVGDLTTTKLSCGCSSVITIRSPRRFFIENGKGGISMINIGDAGPSRIKKNGIFAALDSAAKLAQVLTDHGNTSLALEIYKSYISRQYIWDNLFAEPILNCVDILLQESHTRQVISGLLQHNIPIASQLFKNTTDYLLSGRGAYWRLPYEVLRESLDYPGDKYGSVL